MTNQAMFQTVRRDVELAVYQAVGGAMGPVVGRAVYDAVDGVVYEAVDVAAPRAVSWAIITRRGPPHPGLELYLNGVVRW